MLSDSFILRVLYKIKNKISIYFKYSTINKILSSISHGISLAVGDSRIIGFFFKDWCESASSADSLSYKVLSFPHSIIKRISRGSMVDRLNSYLMNSCIINKIKSFFNNMSYVSTMSLGLLLLSATLTDSILSMSIGGINLVLLIISVGLILINRPLNALCAESKVMKLALSFFEGQVK